MGPLSTKAVGYVCLVSLLIGVTLGAWGMHTWQVSDLKTELAVMAAKLKHEQEKPPKVKETVETKTQIQWAYGEPKEIIKYVDSSTGQEVAQPVDMKYTFNKPEFVFTVNGKPAKFTKTDDERFIFDKNMGSMSTVTTVRLEAEIPTVDKTRRNSIGGWYTNHGAAISVGHAPTPNFEIKGIVGVPNPRNLWGGGVELRF